MRNTHERADFVMFMVGFLPSEGLFRWRRKNRKETSLFDCGIWNGDLELKLIRGDRQGNWCYMGGSGIFRWDWLSPWEDTCVAI